MHIHASINLALTAAVLIGASASCSKEQGGPGTASGPEGIQIPVSQVPLYADLDKYNLAEKQPATRSSEETVTLEELLDRSETTTYKRKGVRYVQTPFKDNKDGIIAVLHDNRNSLDIMDATGIRKYYIETSGKKTQAFVATMIPDKGYEKSHGDYDYLHKGGFTGLVLFSTPEGRLFYTRSYKGGKIDRTVVFKAESIRNVENEQIQYFSLLVPSPSTRGPGLLAWLIPITGGFYGGQIDPSSVSPSSGGGGSGAGGTGPGGNGNPNDGVTPGGAGHNNNYLDIDIEMPEDFDDPPEEPMFSINVSTNIPQHVIVLGNGDYAEGEYAVVDCVYYDIKPEDWPFVAWTGDLQGYTSPTVLVHVNNNVDAMALFQDPAHKIPCWNNENGKWNPMTNMEVARTGKDKTTWKGGLYGKNNRIRYDKNTGKKTVKGHQGIDLIADIGTPVYATHTGTIVVAKSKCPKGYQSKGTGWSFGNEIRIRTTVLNPSTGKYETLDIQYAHLRNNDPIAVNPATGEPFKVDDPVFAGQLIGYTGKSGNAWNIDFPHLHYGVKFADTDNWTDPTPYLNIDFNMKTLDTDRGVLKISGCQDGESYETEVQVYDEPYQEEE